MKIYKYDRHIYLAARLLLGYCPVCKTPAIDKRYKDKRMINSCNIYRTSETSITMQCKQCGLHFTVTWKSLARAIAEKADSIAHDPQQELLYTSYMTAFQILQRSVNIDGVLRNTK